MKRVYVNEEWCLGCHLCEYNCAFANSNEKDMVSALKGKSIFPRIHIEENDKICYNKTKRKTACIRRKKDENHGKS